jgi:ubiquinone/menaquinone biosynthesis C-methylase UbiE
VTSKNWDARVADAELIARSPAFRDLRARIVELSEPQTEHTVVDVGSGTGLLSLAFAERTARVWAIDSSPAMCEYLRVKASSAALHNVETVLASAVSLPLIDGVADLVVSNYCLHELRHADKYRALAEARRVLQPGGRLVIGDMMFSLNPMQSRDRQVVTVKLRLIARRGLPGLWRLLKNAARLASGRWEYPANAAWWHEALKQSGFDHVSIEMLAHEAALRWPRRPLGASVSAKRTFAQLPVRVLPSTLPSRKPIRERRGPVPSQASILTSARAGRCGCGEHRQRVRETRTHRRAGRGTSRYRCRVGAQGRGGRCRPAVASRPARTPERG